MIYLVKYLKYFKQKCLSGTSKTYTGPSNLDQNRRKDFQKLLRRIMGMIRLMIIRIKINMIRIMINMMITLAFDRTHVDWQGSWVCGKPPSQSPNMTMLIMMQMQIRMMIIIKNRKFDDLFGKREGSPEGKTDWSQTLPNESSLDPLKSSW